MPSQRDDVPSPAGGAKPGSGSPSNSPPAGSGPFMYGVHCHGDSVEGQEPCGLVELTPEQYLRQLSRPDSLWYCPNCGSTATWDDDSLCLTGDAD